MDTLELYAKAAELSAAGRRFALASVVHATGSTPQKAGANALFEAAGPVWGTLGGGCMEAESRRRALQALDEGKPLLFDLKLDEVTGWDDGLICGGSVRILVQPNPAHVEEILGQARAARESRRPGLIATVLRHPELPLGAARWVAEPLNGGGALLTDPSLLRETLRHARAGSITPSPETELFAEPVVPPPALIIAGAGHIGKALARQSALLGFEVTVIDDRESFANRENLPGARQIICGDIANALAKLDVDPQTYIVIVTRGHRHDGAALAACINTPAAFIGMIGSRRKSLLVRRALLEEGLATEAQLARVVSPLGLDIGAESVEEIALSIAAQLVAVRRRQAFDAPAMNFAP